MATEHEEPHLPEIDGDETLTDLDIDPEEASNVKGGRTRLGDPCDGGE
jgi:hypothetical protein